VKQSPFHLSIMLLGVFIGTFLKRNHSLPSPSCGALRSLIYVVFVDLTEA
jgi:hypothetical protein